MIATWNEILTGFELAGIGGLVDGQVVGFLDWLDFPIVRFSDFPSRFVDDVNGVGLLDCWIVGLLDCWIVGLLDWLNNAFLIVTILLCLF
ncbi:MAG: hypothetical protein AB8B56_11720 [Crocinitomicaceae bacterium]